MVKLKKERKDRPTWRSQLLTHGIKHKKGERIAKVFGNQKLDFYFILFSFPFLL